MQLFANQHIVKKHHDDAGFDLSSAERVLLKAGVRTLVNTGLRIQIPSGWHGQVWSRSGLSGKGVVVSGGGIVDSGYVGEIKVYLTSDTDFQIERGDRIAQLVIVQTFPAFETNVVEYFHESRRGENGFGSTGV
jgi:dUTP pyrophosphatase